MSEWLWRNLPGPMIDKWLDLNSSWFRFRINLARAIVRHIVHRIHHYWWVNIDVMTGTLVWHYREWDHDLDTDELKLKGAYKFIEEVGKRADQMHKELRDGTLF
jgi:hypothetical protein